MNEIGWGQAVLNVINWGSNGHINGLDVTNILTENNSFISTENDNLIVKESGINSGGFGTAYDTTYSGQTLLER